MNTKDDFQREGLSLVEASAVAGIGRTKLYQAISEGALCARKYGKRTLILRADLQQFLTALPIIIAPADPSTTTTKRVSDVL